jgi:undecaprenyl diphosphate synthase
MVNGAARSNPEYETVGASVPAHIAIIMDGNGRWAEQQTLPRHEGHRAGTRNIRRIVEGCVEAGVKYLTVYAFSTENWQRPDDEVRTLLAILEDVINEQTAELHARGVRLLHLGRTDRISPALRDAITRAVDLTRHNTRLTLSVAFDYGGRDEIIQAVRGMLRDGLRGGDVSDDALRRYLYLGDLPDPDLVIRTAGEMRMSNFLLWQCAYSEFYSTPALWPDFGKQELQKALDAYQHRQRRYGRIPSNGSSVQRAGNEIPGLSN